MEIYLLMESSGSYEDYRCIPIDSFTSEILANKAANGWDDITTILVAESKSKFIERDDKLEVFWDLHDRNEDLNEDEEAELNAIYEEYEKYDYYQWEIPSYSVQKLNLNNF